MVQFLPLSVSVSLARSVTRMVALVSQERNRKAFRKALKEISRLRYRPSSWSTHHRRLFECLEPRHLMAAVPIANNDAAFYTSISTDLVVTTSSNPAHLLANDIDIDGGSITSSLVTNPASGTPNIVNNLPSPSGRGDGGEGGILTTGNLSLTEQLTPDQTLIYRSDSLFKPIISVETQLAPGVSVPSAITAKLTFNGTVGTTYSYTTSGMVTGQSLRFALQADGSSLATGMYDYTLTVATTIGGVTTNQSFTGKQAIVNRSISEFGSNWWLDGLHRVIDSSAGALLVQGNGDTLWFVKSGSNYLHANGDTSYSTLVKTGTNTFTLTSKTGVVSNFSTTGLLMVACGRLPILTAQRGN
jgi:hypothetical protein